MHIPLPSHCPPPLPPITTTKAIILTLVYAVSIEGSDQGQWQPSGRMPSPSPTHAPCNPLCIQDGWTALLEASSGDHRDIAELLLKHKAAVDHQDNVTRGEGLGGGAYGGRSRRWRYLLLMAVAVWVSTLVGFECG